MNMANQRSEQLLHLVFGGELDNLDNVTFKDLDKLDVMGMYPNYATAYTAWKGAAQRTVDNAHMRYRQPVEMSTRTALQQGIGSLLD